MAIRKGVELSLDEIEAAYTAIGTSLAMPESFYVDIERFAGRLHGLRVLDVGCGNGRLMSRLASQAPSELCGIEISHGRVRMARKTVGDRAHFVRGNAETLPFDSGSFDRVFLTEVVEHIVSPENCLLESRRVLNAEGRLILTFPNLSSYFPLYLLAGHVRSPRLLRILVPDDHPSRSRQPIDGCYRFQEMRSLLKKSGFRIVQTEGSQFFPYIYELPKLGRFFRARRDFIDRVSRSVFCVRLAYNMLVACELS